MKVFPEYSKYDGLGLAELVRKKEISPLELVEEAVRRIEAHNPRLNAVVTKLYETARDDAKKPLSNGPFAGVPFLVKDLFATVAGVPTSNGNRLLRNIHAREDSEIVKRWRAAGLIILGKTNTPEFGLTPYTEPGAFGPTYNPWDLTRTPGGSSGGSGAAVAARLVPIASASDGGGSIRIPASACGIFGLKPTRARTPNGPEVGEIWHGFAIEHALTRSVRDSAALLDAAQGPDIGAPYHAPPRTGRFLDEVSVQPGKLRIAVTCKPMLGKNVHPHVLDGFEATAKLLEKLGHSLTEAAPPVDGERFSVAFLTILAAELRADIEEAACAAETNVSIKDFDLATFGLGMLGKAFSGKDYAAASRYLQTSARKVAHFFEGYDLLLTPTLSQPPVKTGSLQPVGLKRLLIGLLGRLDWGRVIKWLGLIDQIAGETFEFIPWTPVFNVTGQPAMSVPLFWSEEKLPIGMHFVSKFGDEATLLRLAGQLEKEAPWAEKAPEGFED